MATAMDPPPVSDQSAALVPILQATKAHAQASDAQALNDELQEAVRMGNAAKIRFLVRRGAALNTVDESKRTPLMLAVIFDQPVAVKQLLALGANRGAKDKDGLTAFAHARKLGLPRIARLLDKH